MADNDFVEAVGANGKKRMVPPHYLDNPNFGYKLPPSARVKANPATVKATNPARPENGVAK